MNFIKSDEEEDFEYKIFYENFEIKEVKRKQNQNLFKDVDEFRNEILDNLEFCNHNENINFYQKIKQNKINIVDFTPIELIKADKESENEQFKNIQKSKSKKFDNCQICDHNSDELEHKLSESKKAGVDKYMSQKMHIMEQQ